MQIEQALIAAGGKGTRLAPGGVPPGAKALLTCHNQPFIFWQLVMLRAAGIEKVILASDSPDALDRLTHIVDPLRSGFRSLLLVRDDGLGTHGLPAQFEHLLDDSFLFEAGHSMLPPVHYRRLMAAKSARSWAASAFKARLPNDTRPVCERRTLALPYALDRSYCTEIAAAGYRIGPTLERRMSRHQLACIPTGFPPEFDTPAERQQCELSLRSFLRSSSGRQVLRSL